MIHCIERHNEEESHIKWLKEIKHDRYWILRTQSYLTGFHPLTDSNEKIIATSLPSKQEIARLISTHPETKCINMQLSVCALIDYVHVIGASDTSLLQMFLIFLKNTSAREKK